MPQLKVEHIGSALIVLRVRPNIQSIAIVSLFGATPLIDLDFARTYVPAECLCSLWELEAHGPSSLDEGSRLSLKSK